MVVIDCLYPPSLLLIQGQVNSPGPFGSILPISLEEVDSIKYLVSAVDIIIMSS